MLKIVAAVLVLYVYQGAVETEVPRIIVFLFLLFFRQYIDNKIVIFIFHQVEAFMNSTIEREYRQDTPTAVTVGQTLIEQVNKFTSRCYGIT